MQHAYIIKGITRIKSYKRITMSEQKLFGKCKSLELRAELEQAKKKTRPQGKVKNVMKKAIANIILNNNELVNLMPEVVALMAIDDLELRKLCSQFIGHYAILDVSAASESLKFYERFSSDVNPALRIMALKTVTSVNVKEFVMTGFSITKRLIADSSPHVRSTAAFSTARLFQWDPEKVVNSGLINDLKNLVYDENPTVVVNALAALDPIIESSDTVAFSLDRKLALQLVHSVSSAYEWRQATILNSLLAFVPQNPHDSLTIIESVLPCLAHENSAVVLNAIKVVVYMSNYVANAEYVIPSLPKRIATTLVSLLSKPPEVQFLVLRNVILLLLGKRFLLDVDVDQFFWKYDDPIFIKDTKLEIIYLLADENNVDLVFRELEEYATEIDVSMARKAIRAFGNLAIKLDITAQQAVDILMGLLADGVPYIVQESIVVLKNVLRKYPGRFDYTVASVVDHYRIVDEPDAKAAMCWIVGHYCESIPNAGHVLSYLVLAFHESPLDVQYALLTAVVKFYVKFPVQGEPLVLNVLKWATEDSDNPDVRDRGFFYWRLITHADNSGAGGDFQKRTKEIILDKDSLISSENESIDPSILEELELNIGTLASIYLKSVEHVFRYSKRKSLPQSPALHPRKNQPPNPPSRALPLSQPQPLPKRQSSLLLDHLPPNVPGKRASSVPRMPRTASPLRNNSTSNSFASGGSRSHSESEEKVGLGKRLTRKASKLIRKN